MCITRAGRVVEASHGRGRVDFFDGRSLDDVDLSVVGAEEGAYVEVFGNMALSVLSPGEAKKKRRAWTAVRRAAMKVSAGAASR
jgi:hydrogenase maturation factor